MFGKKCKKSVFFDKKPWQGCSPRVNMVSRWLYTTDLSYTIVKRHKIWAGSMRGIRVARKKPFRFYKFNRLAKEFDMSKGGSKGASPRGGKGGVGYTPLKPGGNKPSTTGKPSCGGRGNLPPKQK
ncbi:MAG: hypothetical protein MdMp014T_0974 [Treponematales bacterium]